MITGKEIKQNRQLLLVLVISLFVSTYFLSSYFLDQYRVVRDVQNFYWMARAQDPALFPIDFIYLGSYRVLPLEIFGKHVVLQPLSLGYGLIFYVAAMVIDYAWLVKIAALILLLVSVIYLFSFGKQFGEKEAAVSLSLLFVFFMLASPLSISIFSGLQRAFALPILIVFLYYLSGNRYAAAALVIVGASLIYLPNLPLMVLTYLMVLVKFGFPFKTSLSLNKKRVLPLLLAVLFSSFVAAFGVASQLRLLPNQDTELFVAAVEQNTPVHDLPRFQTGGSTPLFIGFPFLGRAGIFDTGGDVLNFIVLMIFSALIYKIAGRSSLARIPRPVWYLAAAGLVMYAVSLFFVFVLSSFALYLPSRYTRSTLMLAALFYVGLNWSDLIRLLPNWLRRNRKLIVFACVSFVFMLGSVYLISPNRQLLIPTFWFIGLVACGLLTPLGVSALAWLIAIQPSRLGALRWGVATIILLLTILMATIYIDILGVKTTNPSAEERAAYEFVATLPKDAVMIGDPDLMTSIPLFSKRSVLFREMFPHPQAPITQYFDSQYADTPQPMLDFCRQYQVNYVILNQEEFKPHYMAREQFFYEPWNSQIVEIVDGRTEFALLDLQPIFTSGPYRVIKCDAETFLAASQK